MDDLISRQAAIDVIGRSRKDGRMNQCDICEEMGCKDCANCYLGNPCLNCEDYDRQTDKCKSNGGCAERTEE